MSGYIELKIRTRAAPVQSLIHGIMQEISEIMGQAGHSGSITYSDRHNLNGFQKFAAAKQKKVTHEKDILDTGGKGVNSKQNNNTKEGGNS